MPLQLQLYLKQVLYYCPLWHKSKTPNMPTSNFKFGCWKINIKMASNCETADSMCQVRETYRDPTMSFTFPNTPAGS